MKYTKAFAASACEYQIQRVGRHRVKEFAYLTEYTNSSLGHVNNISIRFDLSVKILTNYLASSTDRWNEDVGPFSSPYNDSNDAHLHRSGISSL